MPQRVTDGLVDRLAISSNLVQLTLDEARNLPVLWRSLALDLRDSRAECAKWRECAEALAGALRESALHCGDEDGTCCACAALASFDAMKNEAGCD